MMSSRSHSLSSIFSISSMLSTSAKAEGEMMRFAFHLIYYLKRSCHTKSLQINGNSLSAKGTFIEIYSPLPAITSFITFCSRVICKLYLERERFCHGVDLYLSLAVFWFNVQAGFAGSGAFTGSASLLTSSGSCDGDVAGFFRQLRRDIWRFGAS